MTEVSTCIISYNQEKYIGQAIESALLQKCSFESEIIICDDASTDETRKIILSYVSKFPGKIKAHFAEQNIGMLKNWEKALKLCTGKYIALLEGDDFWTDENKLQKQYQILENNSDYTISFTNANIQYENGKLGFDAYVTLKNEEYTTVDLMKYNFIPTGSVLMRNNISNTFFHAAYFKSPFADWIVHVLNSKFGKIHFLNEFTTTYRVHSAGVWGGTNEEKQLKNKLKAIDCIGEIVTDRQLKFWAKQSRKEILQNICALYQQQKSYLDYLIYRIKLLLN